MKILVMNCGSSSLKYQLFDMNDESVLAKGLCERIGIDGSELKHQPADKDDFVLTTPMGDHTVAISAVLDALVDKDHGVVASLAEVGAVGHRVVHGGEFFSSSVVIDENVEKAIEECGSLAPLHNPPNLMGIHACQKLMPNVPQVAVFDTAFHQTMPERAYMYALPYEMYEKHKIRRYGFHGTSHRYVSERAAAMLNKPYDACKIITCHLGNGASVCAVKDGRSVDTSMGFTPLEGLVMGTRCGDIDPAIISFIMEKENMTVKQVENMLNKQSGVLGLSGVSSDFRDIEAAADNGSKRAQIALDVYAYQVVRYIGAYIALLNGADAIVFTAGIGENSAFMRERICAYLGYLGLYIDREKDSVRGKEIDVATSDSKLRALVIPTNEELIIARDTKELLTA